MYVFVRCTPLGKTTHRTIYIDINFVGGNIKKSEFTHPLIYKGGCANFVCASSVGRFAIGDAFFR